MVENWKKAELEASLKFSCLLEVAFRCRGGVRPVGVEHLRGELREVAQPAHVEGVVKCAVAWAAKGHTAVSYKISVDFMSDDVRNGRCRCEKVER